MLRLHYVMYFLGIYAPTQHWQVLILVQSSSVDYQWGGGELTGVEGHELPAEVKCGEGVVQ